jgi:hypothetical protein
MKKIIINNQTISINLSNKDDDYISLTDMAKYKDPELTGVIIANWISTRYSIQFMGIWEQLHNPDFNVIEFNNIKNNAGTYSFIISSSRWINLTNAMGIKSSPGRYGGTFAHKDIAFEFATWLSPEFKLYLIKEFQRLKNEENERKNLDWNVKRSLTKINYKIHTNSIKENIIIPNKLSVEDSNIIYANEADVLNVSLFCMTAKDRKLQNKNKVGNIRDYVSVIQLICLSNLEVLNSEYIKSGLSQKDRLIKLNNVAIEQMKILIGNKGYFP